MVKPGKVLVFVLLSAVMVFAGCGESTPQATETSTLLSETYTPKPLFTDIPFLTFTPMPSYTPSPTLNPLQANFWKSVDFFNEKCGNLTFEAWDSMSPDLGWVVCYDYQEVRLVNKDGVQWDFQVAKEYGVDSFPGEFKPLHWTNDKRYVYIGSYQPIDGGEIPRFGSNDALWRMDLANGDVSEILKPDVTQHWSKHYLYDISVSPTDRRLVYITQFVTPLSATVMDLNTGDTEIIPLPDGFINAGIFAWSPDGTVLVIELAGVTGNNFEDSGFFSLMYVDFINQSSGIFSEHNSLFLNFKKIDNSNLTFTDKANLWQFNFHTHELSLISTLTPTPTP